MTYEVAKNLLIELQCANKNITEQQNDALTFVISILDDLVIQCDRSNYGLERHMIKEACPEYSDKEVEAYIKGYEEKEIEIRDKIMEDKVIEVADVQPIKHGRWIECCNEFDKKCSCCDKVHGTIYEREPFCPNCGARMDGDTE